MVIMMQNYFSDPWNVFDFIIVLGSITDIIYTEVTVSGFLLLHSDTEKQYTL